MGKINFKYREMSILSSVVMVIMTLVFLSGCTNTTTVSSEAGGGGGSSEPDTATVCAHMCEINIQGLCEEEIATNKANGISMEDSILDETYCQLACEAEWDDNTFDCVSAADTCAQFLDASPYCMENGDVGDVVGIKPGNCDKACRKYSDCAAYTEGAGPADIEDAYQSCLEVCPAWTDDQRNCVVSTAINSSMDCLKQTACVLPQVKALMGR
ncbi:MAG: hypothetical protein V1738_03450 [Patescibacteria group bacterium]